MMQSILNDSIFIVSFTIWIPIGEVLLEELALYLFGIKYDKIERVRLLLIRLFSLLFFVFVNEMVSRLSWHHPSRWEVFYNYESLLDNFTPMLFIILAVVFILTIKSLKWEKSFVKNNIKIGLYIFSGLLLATFCFMMNEIVMSV